MVDPGPVVVLLSWGLGYSNEAEREGLHGRWSVGSRGGMGNGERKLHLVLCGVAVLGVLLRTGFVASE